MEWETFHWKNLVENRQCASEHVVNGIQLYMKVNVWLHYLALYQDVDRVMLWAVTGGLQGEDEGDISEYMKGKLVCVCEGISDSWN